MQSNILITNPISKSINFPISGSTNIFMEMEKMGIDVEPFLEIAALDIIKQFGDDALKYSSKIEKNFIATGDIDSALIWAKISEHLNEIQIN